MSERSCADDDAGGGEQPIKCLLCMGSVLKAELLDHIAGGDLNYTPHKCDACEFKCFSVDLAVKHTTETRHPVVLQKIVSFFQTPYNKYAEAMIMQTYNDSISAHAEGGQAQDKRVREEIAQVTSSSAPPIPVDAVMRSKREAVPRNPDSADEERREEHAKKKKKVLSEPKRPMTAWMFYLHERKDQLAKEARDAGLNFLVHANAVYASEDKSKWEQLAAVDKKRYDREKRESQAVRTSADGEGQ